MIISWYFCRHCVWHNRPWAQHLIGQSSSRCMAKRTWVKPVLVRGLSATHIPADWVRGLGSNGEPGLVDKVLALHAGSRGFDSHRGHMSERFFRSNRPGYPHPVSSELENSGIRVAVGDCSVTERRRWRPPYQTGKTVHVHAKHYKHNEDGRTAPGVCGNGSVPLSHSGYVVTRIGIHTHTHRGLGLARKGYPYQRVVTE